MMKGTKVKTLFCVSVPLTDHHRLREFGGALRRGELAAVLPKVDVSI